MVFIIEGEINAASLGILVGLEGLEGILILSPGSAGEKLPSSLKGPILDWWNKGASFIIKADTDPSGKAFVNRIASQLVLWGIPHKAVHITPYNPMGFDLNQLLLMRAKEVPTGSLGLGVTPRRIRRADPSRAYVLRRLEHKDGNLRTISMETGRELKSLSRIQDRTKPLTGEVHSIIMEALDLWVKASLGEGASVKRLKRWARDLATSVFLRALDRTYDARYLIGALRASISGEDKSVWEYGRKRDLIGKYAHLLTWERKRKPVWGNTSRKDLALTLAEIVLKEIGPFHPPSPDEEKIARLVTEHRALYGKMKGGWRNRWSVPLSVQERLMKSLTPSPHFKWLIRLAVLKGEGIWDRKSWYSTDGP